MTSSNEFERPRPEPLLIVLSGPSGAGKDTVVQRMKERGLPFHFVVTATTRHQRPNEVDGRDYFFVSKDEFARMIEQDELFEYAVVYGDYKGNAKQQVRKALASGKDVVMRLDVQGAETVRKLAPDALLIFITTDNEDELVNRLKQRKTETSDSLAIRIATARKELQRVEAFDYIIINHDFLLDHTVDIVRAIIDSEHHRVKQRKVKFVNNYPASPPDQQPVSPPQTVRVPMPSSRPYMTYTIMGITIGFYLLQLVSVSLFGYANDAAQMDWLELYGSKINELNSCRTSLAIINAGLVACIHSAYSLQYVCAPRDWRWTGTLLWTWTLSFALCARRVYRQRIIFSAFEWIFRWRFHRDLWLDRRGGRFSLSEPKVAGRAIWPRHWKCDLYYGSQFGD